MNSKTIFKRSIWVFVTIIFIFGTISPVFAEDVVVVLPDWHRGIRNPELSQKIDSLGTEIVLNLPIPVLFGVKQSDLTKNFGDYRAVNRTHEGLDIMAPIDTPVVSPTKAVVTSFGNQETAGNYVYTRNPGGEVFGYMHLNSFAPDLKVGTLLEVGDLIGFVGKTGNAQWGDPHLHFEIRHDVATDPYPRLTREFTETERAAIVAKFPSIKQVALQVSSNYQFSRSLSLGMTGDDVQQLQKFLNNSGFTVATSGVGSPGFETKTFGPLTRSAVTKYQIAKGISPTVGFFGPITRASVNGSILALNTKL